MPHAGGDLGKPLERMQWRGRPERSLQVQRQIESDTTLEPDKARRSVLLAELNTEAREVRDALRVLRAFTEVEDISVGKVEPPAPTLPLEVRPT